MTRWLILAALLITALPAWAQAASNRLNWTDNSANEANFHVERKIVPNPVPVTAPVVCPAGGFAEIASVGANVNTFTDAAVSENVAYCYQVRASNPGGSSGYTNMAGRYVPLAPPANPTGLGVVAGP